MSNILKSLMSRKPKLNNLENILIKCLHAREWQIVPDFLSKSNPRFVSHMLQFEFDKASSELRKFYVWINTLSERVYDQDNIALLEAFAESGGDLKIVTNKDIDNKFVTPDSILYEFFTRKKI